MPFLGAISAPNLVKMRGSSTIEPRYTGTIYLSACPNANIYTARINQTTFDIPLAELTYDGGSGTLADILVGMTVLISHTNNRSAAFFRGRVRKTPTATVLYINETDGTQFDDNDYIFVLNDFALHEKLARDVSGTLYPDWDVAFRRLKPIIRGLKSAYADWVSGGVYTLAFAPTVTAATSGATISTYLWDVADGTITVGADSDKDITVTFPAGFRWINFTTTDSNGVAQTRYIPIWSHDPDTYPPQILETGEFTVSASIVDGYNASVTAFDGVDTIIDNTLVCAWVDEQYNSTKQHINQNVVMVGRLRTENNETEFNDEGNRDDKVTFEIEGVLTQLSHTRTSAIEISPNASPDAFNEVTSLTIWRAVQLLLTEYCTFAELHSLYLGDTGTTFLYGTLTTAGHDIKSSVVDLGDSINAILQASGTGECEFVRKSAYLSTTARSALATVIGLTTTDIIGDLGYNKDHIKNVGKISADGGGYNSTSNATTAYLASAPAGAPAPGTDESELRRQVLTANQTVSADKTELKQRVGNALAEAQTPTGLTVALPDGYWFLTPDVAAWYTITLAGTETTRGIVLSSTVRWLLMSVDVVFNVENGSIGVSAMMAQETSGEEGEIVYLPAVETDEYPITVGEFDEFIDIPSLSDVGTTIDFTNCTDGWIGTGTCSDGWNADCVGGTSEYVDIAGYLGAVKTITSITVTYDATYAGGADNLNHIYAKLSGSFWITLATFTTVTGNNQTYTVNVNNLPADYLRLRMYAGGSNCTGSLLVKNVLYQSLETSSEWTHTFDFTTDVWSWNLAWSPDGDTATQVDGTGIVGATDQHTDGVWRRGYNAQRTFALTYIVSMSITYSLSKGNINQTGALCFGIHAKNGATEIHGESHTFAQMTNGDNQIHAMTVNGTCNSVDMYLFCSRASLQADANSGYAYGVSVTIVGTGVNPFL